jgi:hypothetical protein
MQALYTAEGMHDSLESGHVRTQQQELRTVFVQFLEELGRMKSFQS